jgi:uncharacterized protein (TIGR02271 family)
VTAVGREQVAESILREYGGYDIEREDTTGEVVSGEPVASEGMAGSPMPSAWMAGEGTTTAGMLRDDDEAQRMTAYEEQLSVQKRSVDKGDVKLRKEVHTEHRTIDVPVQREEVVIERRAPSGESTGSMEGHQEIRIPIREEQVSIEKVPVAKEDVIVGKRTVQDTQRVSADLRKEEIRVDADPDVPVRNRRDEA